MENNGNALYSYSKGVFVCQVCGGKTRFPSRPIHLKSECAVPNFERLTDRELEVVTLLSRGSRTKQIAESLDITEKTVVAHRYNIYRKLGVKNIAEATRIVMAREQAVSQ